MVVIKLKKRKREENKRSHERCPNKGQNKTLSAMQGIAAHYSMHESAIQTKLKLKKCMSPIAR